MYRLRPELDPKKRVKPCEVFDIIVGTGTGGLIAIMLGRLVRLPPRLRGRIIYLNSLVYL
jgi:hypothetical protein